MITITQVNIKMYTNSKTKLVAYATLVVNGSLKITNIRIINTGDRFIVSMPSRPTIRTTCACQCAIQNFWNYCPLCGNFIPKTQNDKENNDLFRDIVFPVNKETRTMINEAVLTAYHEELRILQE